MSGLFTSRLIYCITVWAAIWHIPGDYEIENKRTSMSKKDMHKLQALQNKALRLIHGTDRSESTENLLKRTDSLSVHQLAAYHTLLQAFKIKNSGLPTYHSRMLFGAPNVEGYNSRSGATTRVNFNLSLGRGYFFYMTKHI